jgi:hypothetical protein
LEGIECESVVEGNTFSCRWKGAELRMLDDDGNEVFTEDFTVKDLLNIIREKGMTLENMSAYYDTANIAKITELMFRDADGEYEFDINLVTDEIDFCD